MGLIVLHAAPHSLMIVVSSPLGQAFILTAGDADVYATYLACEKAQRGASLHDAAGLLLRGAAAVLLRADRLERMNVIGTLIDRWTIHGAPIAPESRLRTAHLLSQRDSAATEDVHGEVIGDLLG